MLQYSLLRLSPRALRWYRTTLTLDLPRLLSFLPEEGKLLEVGCGVGSLSSEIARRRPLLDILGIDIAADSVRLANHHYARPNLRFECKRLEDIGGAYDCVLLCDVLHHVERQEHEGLLAACRSILREGGVVVIKDIERDKGQVGWWMDRYISRCPAVSPLNCDEMVAQVGRLLHVIESEVRFRTPFPHYYIKAGTAAS